MNHISAKYSSKVILRHSISKFDVKIDNCKVEIESQQEKLYVQISGRRKEEKLKKILSDLETLFFFYLGSFPMLESIQINGNTVDISKRANKFKTSNNFLKDNLVICDINANTVTEEKIIELRKIRSYPIYSFQCLLSQSYDSVITNHKMTLLLHIIDGMYEKDKKTLAIEKQTIKDKYPESNKGTVGDYMAAVYWLCNNYFLNITKNMHVKLCRY